MREPTIVTVQVFYFIPNYRSLLNSFLWQTLDVSPRYPRIGRFLDFWRREIDAVIQDVVICDSNVRGLIKPPYIPMRL